MLRQLLSPDSIVPGYGNPQARALVTMRAHPVPIVFGPGPTRSRTRR